MHDRDLLARCPLLVLAALVRLFLPGELPQDSPRWARSHAVATVWDRQLDELSGLAFSARDPQLLYAHNDSGDGPNLYVLNRRGQRVATWTMRGVIARDVEDIATGPCAPDDPRRCIHVADIGDNRHRRPDVQLYRIIEPEDPARGGELEVLDTTSLAYPDGPHDAEALVVDPHRATRYIIHKARQGRSRVWRVPDAGGPSPVTPAEIATLQLTGEARGARLATAADLSPDGRCLALRTYQEVWTYCGAADQDLAAILQTTPDRMRPPLMFQSEALAWAPEGDALWLGGERWPAPLVRVRAVIPSRR